ncbi:MAG: hypothetical protein ACHQRM_04910 [Bacteroidia bacterium]
MDAITPIDQHTDSSDEDFDAAIDELYKASKWMKFLAILGFIGVGMMALAGLFSLAAPGGRGMVVMIFLLLMAVIIFIPCRFLYKYAQGAHNFVRTQNGEKLEEALAYQRSLWRFTGVMYLIYIVLMALGLLFGFNSKMFSSY